MPDSQLLESTISDTDRCGRASLKGEVLREALQCGYLSDKQLVSGFINVTGVSKTITSLIDAFPAHFEHTFAAKANAMSQSLAIVRNHGLGCEVASAGELRQALKVGFAPEKIVYDEPAKTTSAIHFVLENGINFNIDNFQEFERVKKLTQSETPRSRIGFRINPQVGSGNIGAMSTATNTSKFGVAINDPGNRERLLNYYQAHAWLTSIHTHIGSQGCSLELMVAGIRKVVDLAKEINASLASPQISVIDIGGGLPVNFESEEVTPTFAHYSATLQSAVPELFSGEFTVKTEFGRSIYAKNGFIATRVEYTKESGGRHIAITHAGAQTATRTAFMPELWAIRLSVFDSFGNPRKGTLLEQDVAGPCCFAGDMLAKKRPLPRIEPGDYVVLHDTGAYYFSNPFFYNNLPAIAVYGASENDAGGITLEPWRKQQSIDDMLAVIG